LRVFFGLLYDCLLLTDFIFRHAVFIKVNRLLPNNAKVLAKSQVSSITGLYTTNVISSRLAINNLAITFNIG